MHDSLSEMPSENQAEVEVEVEETPTVSPARQGATPKHLITEDWQPSPDDLVWAAAECPAVNARVETANFVDYFLDKGEKRPGWTRSWKRWMREAQLRAGARPLRAVNDRDPQYAWDV